MEGGYDPDNRRCFDWDESHWDRKYGQKFTELLGLREVEAVQSGSIRIEACSGLLVISRALEEEKLVLLSNQSGAPVHVDSSGDLLLHNLFTTQCSEKRNGSVVGELQTDGYVVIWGNSSPMQK